MPFMYSFSKFLKPDAADYTKLAKRCRLCVGDAVCIKTSIQNAVLQCKTDETFIFVRSLYIVYLNQII